MKKIFLIGIVLFGVLSSTPIAEAQQDNFVRVDINAPWEKVCHPDKKKCTWRMINSSASCSSDYQC